MSRDEPKPDSKPDGDLARQGRELFAAAESAEAENRKSWKADRRFALEGEQWDGDIAKQRMADKRPMLTINKLLPTIQQVINDARQNKPSIKVHPVDSGADKQTAEVIDGLIRNIEVTSNADVAYDTATECAVSGGWGYLRVGLDYAYEDSFEMDLSIQRVANPLSVYGDPNSTAADSFDWDDAFVVDEIDEDDFKKEYGDVAQTDFDAKEWSGVDSTWRNEDTKKVTIAEWWHREEYSKPITLFEGGKVYSDKDIAESTDLQALIAAGSLVPKMDANGQPVRRTTKCHRVIQRIMTGAEVIKEREWPGKYIPIIPVYGREFDIEGKRYFRSLVHNSIDAQRMYNYWRTTATELVALAPRSPWIGPKGFADDDPNWETANTKSHPFLEYKGAVPPQRMPVDGGVAAGALQEAMNAADDIRGTSGIHEASLGEPSNETSGKAIIARQREGDISTFNFPDNMARAIRHTGRILIDLIPHVYSTERIIRVLGEDGTVENKPINQQYEAPQMGPDGKPVMQQDANGQMIPQVVMAMHDLRVGKYDLTVTTGPSFTTRRQEAAEQMTIAVQSFPDAAPVILPELAKNLDWPGADKIAEKLEQISSGQVPPEVQQQMDQAAQQIQQLTDENQKLKMDNSADMQKAQADIQVKTFSAQKDAEIEQFKATKQIEIEAFKARSQAEMAQQKAVTDQAMANQQMINDNENTKAKLRNDREVKGLQHDEQSLKSGTSAILKGIEQLAAMIVEGNQATQQALQEVARIAGAETELIRDPKTNRAVRGRKVLQ